MGIEIKEMQGSGTLGDIAPGWSLQEFATPVIPSELSGGAGTLSFSAKANDDSLFVVNNLITTQHTSEYGDLGSVTGVVKTITQTGLNVSVTHSNGVLDQFDGERNIPLLASGSVVAAVDLLTQMLGERRLIAGGA